MFQYPLYIVGRPNRSQSILLYINRKHPEMYDKLNISTSSVFVMYATIQKISSTIQKISSFVGYNKNSYYFTFTLNFDHKRTNRCLRKLLEHIKENEDMINFKLL